MIEVLIRFTRRKKTNKQTAPPNLDTMWGRSILENKQRREKHTALNFRSALIWVRKSKKKKEINYKWGGNELRNDEIVINPALDFKRHNFRGGNGSNRNRKRENIETMATISFSYFSFCPGNFGDSSSFFSYLSCFKSCLIFHIISSMHAIASSALSWPPTKNQMNKRQFLRR